MLPDLSRATPDEVQNAVLRVLHDETSTYPDDIHSLPAIDIAPAIGWPQTRAAIRRLAMNLAALSSRGLAWRSPGPGSGSWCITYEGRKLMEASDRDTSSEDHEDE